jgi:hypothetical protein
VDIDSLAKTTRFSVWCRGLAKRVPDQIPAIIKDEIKFAGAVTLWLFVPWLWPPCVPWIP